MSNINMRNINMRNINMTTELTGYELRTRELFNTVEWTPERAMVAQVFRAMWHAAMTAEQIINISHAMQNLPPVNDAIADGIQLALRELVREKVLRSTRTSYGTVYEVAY